jgi:molecular chaperone DnaK
LADDPRTPVAIRISRPFGSEEEFLQHELDTLTRTTVLLLGAQSRPQGVVLRFEVALASGDPLIRGEGRVVGFRAASHGQDSGLTLRFTRLDARSKALVDRAAAMREARARASLHPPRPADVALHDAPHPPPLPQIPPPTEPSLEEAVSSGHAKPPPLPPAASRSRAAPPAPSSGTVQVQMAAVQGARRDELLDRLRQRAKTLSPSDVERLLASRVRRA